jgi:hypothetical protein
MSVSYTLLRSRTAKTVTVAALVAGSFIAGVAIAAQPHMQNALASLRNARNELQMAERNKGGHREAALDLVDRAIIQVERGIEVAR